MNSYSDKMKKSEDIYQLMKKLNSVGWKSIRESSINRIMYLAAVLYSFRYPNEDNILQSQYRFSVTLSGPEDAEIENALINLQSNDVIKQTEEGYQICPGAEFALAEQFNDKKQQWFDDIAYIIAIYGEDKIYDFIFRDPEYRETLQGNSVYNLNIGCDNATVKFLNSFKDAFEEKIQTKEDALDNRQYLELYFEYVFGKILRGEK
jgi:hypothetical protein